MAISNLRMGLERKYSRWLGEKIQVDKEIAEILEAYTVLASKQQRSAKLQKLLDSAEIIFEEIAPTWSAEKVKATMPREQQLPFEPGSVTRWALDILRETQEALTSRTIAETIMRNQGLDPGDKDMRDMIRQAVDSTLRKKVGSLIERQGEWPVFWKIMEFDDRPEA